MSLHGWAVFATFWALFVVFVLQIFFRYVLNRPLIWPHIVLCHAWIPLIFLLIHRTIVGARWSDAVLLLSVLVANALFVRQVAIWVDNSKAFLAKFQTIFT